jgi:hypothetical protein
VKWHESRGRNSDQNEAAQLAAFPHCTRHVSHSRHPHGNAFHHGVFALAAGTPGVGSREGEVMSVYIVHFFRSIVRFLSAPYVLITATAIAFIAVAIIYLAHDNNPEESSTICQGETCLQARTVVFYSVSSDNSHDEPCSEKSLDRLSNIIIPISSTMEQNTHKSIMFAIMYGNYSEKEKANNTEACKSIVSIVRNFLAIERRILTTGHLDNVGVVRIKSAMSKNAARFSTYKNFLLDSSALAIEMDVGLKSLLSYRRRSTPITQELNDANRFCEAIIFSSRMKDRLRASRLLASLIVLYKRSPAEIVTLCKVSNNTIIEMRSLLFDALSWSRVSISELKRFGPDIYQSVIRSAVQHPGDANATAFRLTLSEAHYLLGGHVEVSDIEDIFKEKQADFNWHQDNCMKEKYDLNNSSVSEIYNNTLSHPGHVAYECEAKKYSSLTQALSAPISDIPQSEDYSNRLMRLNKIKILTER